VSLELALRYVRDGFTLEVNATLGRGTTGVFGPNGAGKTTLLHAIAGLLPEVEGRVSVGGVVLQDTDAGVFLPPEKRRVGVVFQDGRLFPHLTVERNLRYGLREGGPGFAEVVDLLELGALLDRRPVALSGGERQRVGIGRALLAAPRLLLLDEPLASLDVRRRRELLPYLRRATEGAKIPVVYVSHHLADLLQVTEQVLVLEGGSVVGHGPVGDLLAEVRVLEVAHRLGLENVLAVDGAVRDEGAGVIRARRGGTELMLPLDAPAHVLDAGHGQLALRPEDVVLVRGEVGRTSARNLLRGRVLRLVQASSHVAVHVDVGWPLVVVVTRSATRELELAPGAEVACLIKTAAFRWVG